MKADKDEKSGLGVDSAGGPVIDPTKNVEQLVEAANLRQDDLRELTKELFASQMRFIEEKMADHERHQSELRKAESDRLNSIRLVDREDVNKTQAQSMSAIQTLAATTNTTAETLRTQVATTAAAAAGQLAAITTEINKRLSALELTSSEGKGKQLVSDPQMDKMMVVVEQLVKGRENVQGKAQGISAAWLVVVGAFGLLSTLLAIGAALYAMLKP